MTDIAAQIVRKRRAIVVGFVVLAAVLLPFSMRASSKLSVGSAAVTSSEAAAVDALLAERFASPFAHALVLAITGLPPLDDVAAIDALQDISAAVKDVPSVAGVLSYLDAVDPTFVSPHGTFMVVGVDPASRRMEDIVLALRDATATVQARLVTTVPTLELSWTGAPAFDYDVRLTSAQDATAAEKRVLPVTLLLLFLVFGSAVGALCPVVIGGLGVSLSLGAAVLVSTLWPMTALLINIVSMIGLGIGIDYTLLVLSRFREELAADADAPRAAMRALRSAGHTVLMSGGAVAIGFAALLFVPATELRSIATGGLLVVAFCVALATVLLPALLAWLGPRVEAGRLWRPRPLSSAAPHWLAWGRWVTAHPLAILIVVGLPLVALAWQARHISTDIPSGNWLPERMESTRGAIALQRMGHGGIVQTIRVVADFGTGGTADSVAGWEEVLRLTRRLASDPRVARVNSLPALLGVETAQQATIAFVHPQLRNAYLSQDGQLALLEIIPHESVSAGALMRYVRELRAIEADARILVGGLPAFNEDYRHAIGGSVAGVIGIIVVGSFVALLIGFRSLLGALKAIALNLLSVAAAMGLTVIVFQFGYGAGWLGVAQPLDGLFPAVPIIVFCVVFGLSMDYEVFLLARVAEGVQRGLSNHDALVEGLARTGGVITSAALVMIVVFAGFSLGDFLIIKILGFALAAAILIDATAVRLAIGPALLQLGGRWNWWPGRRGTRTDPATRG